MDDVFICAAAGGVVGSGISISISISRRSSGSGVINWICPLIQSAKTVCGGLYRLTINSVMIVESSCTVV